MMDFTGSSDDEEFFETQIIPKMKVFKAKGNGFFNSRKKKKEIQLEKPVDLTLPDLLISHFSFQIEGIPVLFPFTPYPSQLEIMAKIISVLQCTKENLLVESPTGTGKTMVLLCASLAWQTSVKNSLASQVNYKKKSLEKDSKDDSNEIPKIFYCSRTHKQLNQVISELKRSPYRPKMTVLGSRSKCCINPRALKQRDVNQACISLMRGISLEDDGHEEKRLSKSQKSCTLFQKVRRLTDKFHDQIYDIEDLIQEGTESHACPYFASRELASTAEIIFTPYNYLIDPFIRESVGINLENAVVIIDEAHNIEDNARESGSMTINIFELDAIQSELIGLTYLAKEGVTGAGERQNNFEDFIPFDSFSQKEDPFYLKYLHEHSSLLSFVKIVIAFMHEIKSWDIYEFERKIKLFKENEIPLFLMSKGITKDAVCTFKRTLQRLQEENAKSSPISSSSPKENQESSSNEIPRILSLGSCRVLQKLLFIIDLILESSSSDVNSSVVTSAKDSFVMAISQVQPSKSSSTASSTASTTSTKSRKSLVDEPVIELSFWLLNPSIIFQNLTLKCKSVILTSGSLSPLQSFQSELGTKFLCSLEAPHIIAPSQVWAGVVASSPRGLDLTGTFKSSESFDYQDEIGDSILNLIHVAPFGTLCFFPSFLFLEKMVKRWKSTGAFQKMEKIKRIFIEPRNASSSEDFNDILNAYYQCIEQERAGAIFFAVFRGKASEGINFTDDYARLVISIGIPYPNFKDCQVDLKKKYNDKFHRSKRLIDGNEWYEIQAYRALNQALGRCIRHKDDWGAVVLLESRFANPRSHNFLSKWIRESLQQPNANGKFSTQFASISQFFQSKASPSNSCASSSIYSLGIFPTKSVTIGCPTCKSVLLCCFGGEIGDFDVEKSICCPDVIRHSGEGYFCISNYTLSNQFDLNWNQNGRIDGCEYLSISCCKCPQVAEGTIVQLADMEGTIVIKKSFLM